MLFLIVKQVMKKKNKKKSKKNEKNKSNVKKIRQNQINNFILKFELLALNLNILSEQLKQWDWLSKVSRQMNAADSKYASNFRFTCYRCDKIRYNMRNCADINILINQEIIHQNNTDYLAWDRENTHDISVQFMHDLLWKNDIIKQVKNAMLIKKLSEYCELRIQKKVKMQENYIMTDWKQFWQQLHKQYYQYDTYQQMYLKSFLKIYKN